MLPGCEIFAEAQTVPVELDGAKTVHHLGRISLAGGRALALLEVKLDPKTDVLRNRVGLRNLVARFIDQAHHHGVLAVFVSDRSEYRLSLAVRESVLDREGQLVKKETAPRRYTYVLGPNEPCTTSAERFALLAEKGAQASLDDVVEAFSVERLNKEFFARYKAHYQSFVAHLLSGSAPQSAFGVPHQFKDDDERDRALKPVRDFAKKLLGRLVFLHFLQKKGWLGCPADRNDWTRGDPAFLRKLFDDAIDPQHFHSQRLVPLFFDALNRANRDNSLFKPTGTRVPYLNGGLFDDDLPAARKIDFPAKLFGDLLSFFGEYNFTIDENDPDDHEVGIDPEMLGHVFENLLEDNKDKGAYYTPKAIVQYMCQQSLIRYLQTHLGARAEIETLVRDKNKGDERDKNNWIKSNAAEIERLLDEVKICDPAIGSGAFPIGLLQEIYWIKLTLDWTLDRAATKRRIIQNSIYGVDVDAGAVEIARLRFWLALIVDEDHPSPLPNLDYKIMQGDSLLESFEGIRLDQLFQQNYALNIIGGQAELSLDGPGTQLTLVDQKQRDKLTALTGRYFAEADPAAKDGLHKKIDRLVLEHIEHSIAVKKEMFEIELAQYRTDVADKQRRAKGWKAPLRTAKRMAQLETEIKLCDARGQNLKALEGKPERPYFLWHVYFQDVFERGGFDIVIANPPYVSAIEFSRTHGEEHRRVLTSYYETAAGAYDLFVLFFERTVRLLKQGGVACLITPNKYLSADYATTLREFLRGNTCILQIADASRVDVFKSVSVYPVITTFSRSKTVCGAVEVVRADPSAALGDIAFSHVGRAVPELLDALPQKIWGFLVSPHYELIGKFLSKVSPLKDLVEVQATTTASEADAYGMLLHEDRTANCKVVNTGTLDRFQSLWGIKSLRHQGSDFLYPSLDLNDQTISEQRRSLYRKPKVLFAKIGKTCEAFLDADGAYAGLNINCLHSPKGKWSLEALAAYCNSTTFTFIYGLFFGSLRMAGGYLQFQAPQLRVIPVPDASGAEIERLGVLGARAARESGKNLHSVVSEIDAITYRLFDLAPPEISIVEGDQQESGDLSTASRTILFTRVLPTILLDAPYAAYARVVERLKELEIQLPDDTLRHYLSEAMSTGVVHDAGRGWYSRLAEPFKLDTKPVSNLVRQVMREFPLLEFSCWSTAQVNPYAQHLLSHHTAFLFADADALASVAERLRSRGWEPLVDPNAAEAQKLFRPGEKTVVLRPSLARQPDGGDRYAPVEKLLVDLLVEAPKLKLMDESEVQRVIESVCTAGRVQVSVLAGYARSRRVSIWLVQQSINSDNAENAELMD